MFQVIIYSKRAAADFCVNVTPTSSKVNETEGVQFLRHFSNTNELVFLEMYSEFLHEIVVKPIVLTQFTGENFDN